MNDPTDTELLDAIAEYGISLSLRPSPDMGGRNWSVRLAGFAIRDAHRTPREAIAAAVNLANQSREYWQAKEGQ